MVILQLRPWLVDVRNTERIRASDTWANVAAGARYSTMDNIDGKQARRTGQSSGLGELFEYEPRALFQLQKTDWPIVTASTR